MRTHTRITRTVVLVTASLLGAAGCAGHDSGGGTAAAPRAVKPVPGCGAGSWTDPADLAPDRKAARCDKGAPAARPLAKKRKITVATGTLSAEYVAPLQVAVAKGEFAKEGLDVELKVLPTPDALPLLAKGDVDAQWAAPEAAVMNGINGGFDIKWVAGNFSPDPTSKSGLWVRLKDGESADHVEMAGRKLGTMIGKGSVIAYPMDTSLKKHGGGLDRISFQQLGSADVLTALQNGGVDSAWLLDPIWRKVDGAEKYAFLGGQPVGEPLGGVLFGPTLLNEDPDAGVAFLRAYIRTVNTYFAGDYKSDPGFVTELAKLMKTDEATLRSTPSMRMDWEIRKGTTDRLQEAYADSGVSKGASVPEAKAVDRAMYSEAVGHKL
ncbi:ABC transporter substrate-binding protein [Streptomyces sp. NBC_00264]|uniref:ABC transporter substrate-binding protein n=1 Tax=unclassified Streptomyces TaxID=2593676 RepID=UPI000FAD7845|nr:MULTISPECIES: ABC transporter substrate-binding protein [unclassified Streptomyces]MCX5162836.1 ABC transporter substrate-binding protein [Streptomyces sp. NBC_00305]MCX5221353.1 ABC transporter substrate-binding protein [Streptomyces sp. NBC_00264]RPK76821.1 NMT1/THI5 like protein [Streptomyces sp. ADI95-17]WSC27803.1 ABC transporter substrate-binding protein [Streptomyces sp. NBC_01768]